MLVAIDGRSGPTYAVVASIFQACGYVPPSKLIVYQAALSQASNESARQADLVLTCRSVGSTTPKKEIAGIA